MFPLVLYVLFDLCYREFSCFSLTLLATATIATGFNLCFLFNCDTECPLEGRRLWMWSVNCRPRVASQGQRLNLKITARGLEVKYKRVNE